MNEKVFVAGFHHSSLIIKNMTDLLLRAAKIKLVLTDCDGVLTDAGVYYGETGEVLKKFNIRDGMGVERLRKLCGIETGIITGERSPSVVTRAAKLNITELHLGAGNKPVVLADIMQRLNVKADEIAFIGDDVNDLVVLQTVGLACCPADAVASVKRAVHYRCEVAGGAGCFREVAELIIFAKESVNQPIG
jgi:3-deoxy-D-manno-octulosonate 8-phosphate phosphatase (KDO 8-P phosphatase)